MSAPTPLLTPNECAALLKVSPSTVRRLLRSGALSAVRVGSQWRIRSEVLDSFSQPTEPKHGQSGTAAGPQPRQRSRPAPPSAPIAVDDWLGRKLARKTAR